MKRIRMIALPLAFLILFSALCAACSSAPAAPETTARATESTPPATEPVTTTVTAVPVSTEPETTEPVTTEPVTTAAPESEDKALIRWQNGGTLSFLPKEPVAMVPLSEMTYSRPDVEALIEDYEALTAKVARCNDAEELLEDYRTLLTRCHSARSMIQLAYYRYCQDRFDSRRSAENDYCSVQGAILTEKEAALYAAFAASPCREALEQKYFGAGFFVQYDGSQTAGPDYEALLAREQELISRYYDLLGAASYSRSDHTALGEVFLELVRVRQQLAAAKGFENYLDYSYTLNYGRDYSPAQSRAFLDQVRASLVPILTTAAPYRADYKFAEPMDELDRLAVAAEQMGGVIWDAFRFLRAYELCDLSYSARKQNISFVTYLDEYEAPVILVNPMGRVFPFNTVVHEFGHFVDFYRNYGANDDAETTETYSQAMQYLALAYAGSPEPERSENLRAALADLLYDLLCGCADTDFEIQIYTLDPEELSLETLDAVYAQCREDYGLLDGSDEDFDPGDWVYYSKFYEFPCYLISYPVSAAAALQICQAEVGQPGAGVAAFFRLLNRPKAARFSQVLETAGLQSPFAEGSLEALAAFLTKAFK